MRLAGRTNMMRRTISGVLAAGLFAVISYMLLNGALLFFASDDPRDVLLLTVNNPVGLLVAISIGGAT